MIEEEYEPYEALDYAQDGWLETIQLLKENKEVPDSLKAQVLTNKNDSGETLLHWYLFYERDKTIFEKIINLGFDINSKNKFNFSILYDLAMHQDLDLIEVAIRYGVKIEVEENCAMDSFEHLDYQDFLDEIKRIKREVEQKKWN